MNCRNCNSAIDYNYQTNCPHCGCELEPESLPKLDPSMVHASKSRKWILRVMNLVYVLFTGAVGLVSGAVVLYATGAVIYLTLRGPETRPGENCAEGMAIGLLMVVAGSFLGTVAGTAFAVKHPISKKSV